MAAVQLLQLGPPNLELVVIVIVIVIEPASLELIFKSAALQISFIFQVTENYSTADLSFLAIQ